MGDRHFSTITNDVKMKKITIVNLALIILFVSVGYLALILVFHESWHILQHGKPDGICAGWLNTTSGEGFGSGTIFNPGQPLNLQEENQAWIFGVIIASSLLVTLISTELIRTFKKNNG